MGGNESTVQPSIRDGRILCCTGRVNPVQCLGTLLGGEGDEKTICCFGGGVSGSGLMAVLGSAQMDKASRPSPAAKASCALADGKTITVDYSSPRAKAARFLADWFLMAKCGGREPMRRPLS